MATRRWNRGTEMKDIMEARNATTESIFETDTSSRFLILAFCLLLAGSAGCKQETASMPPPGPPEVEVVTISTQMVADEPEFIGQAESSRPAEIRSQVTGILKEIYF